MGYEEMGALQEIENVKRMIKNSNYVEARDKLIEVRHCFPAVDDISEMITVCEILCSASFRFMGCGPDWYWVLQLAPVASEFNIHFQYHKFTKLLGPMKNYFPGTASALEIIQDAYCVLSNPEKRSVYDSKRAACLEAYKNAVPLCDFDLRQFYDRDFYNFNNIRTRDVFANGQIWAAYDEEHMPRNYARIMCIDKSPFRLHISWLKPAPVTIHERKWCEVGLPVACGFFERDRTRATITQPNIFSHLISGFASSSKIQVEIYPRKHEIWAIYTDWKPYEWCSDPEARKGCIIQMVEILSGYSNQSDVVVASLVKVEGFKSVFRRYTSNGSEQPFSISSSDLFMFSHSVPAYRFVGGEKNGISEGMLELDCLAVPAILDCVMAKSLDEGVSRNSSTFTHCAPTTPLPVLYPKVESLKLKWSTTDFASYQLWAVYDCPDFMPRRYAIVNNVVSGSEVCVTFLEPHPMLDDEICWVKEKLPFVCGSFRAGSTSLNLEISRFSHLVKCERIIDSPFYKIYPKKGEVWAIYLNWDKRWKQSDFSHYKCRVVEIITDFCDESELLVASLVVVPGQMNFFRRQVCDGFELIRGLSRTEILSFSHQIAAFTISGSESHGIPEGSWHLESDALPPNFSN